MDRINVTIEPLVTNVEVTTPTAITVVLEPIVNTVEVNNIAIPPLGRIRAVAFVIDGGGLPLTSGSIGYLELPFDGTITEWTLVADQIGDIVIDIKKATYDNFPNSVSITGTEKPSLLNALKNQSSSLITWDTSLNAGDILEYIVDSSTSIFRVTIVLKVLV